MTRYLIDGNSVLNAALLGGKDEEFGRVIEVDGKKVQVNSAMYGVEKFFEQVDAVCQEFSCAPRDMVLVWDGKNSKARRQTFLPTYKAGRDKAPEVSEQLNLAREIITQSMRDLGATVASQVGYEADDVIGYFCKTLRGERNVVVTSDGDLTVLVDENTDVWRLGKLSENPYGPFPHKFITLYKSLVGDTSDKIPGAKGFGDAAFVDLLRTFGLDGLEMMEQLIIDGKLATLAEDVPSLKSLQKIIDSADMVTTSWRVASLLIEDINTMRKPLEIQAGMVKQWGSTEHQFSALRRFYGTKLLVTASNYAAVYERLNLHKFAAAPFVALDIETSTSEESDEWTQRLKQVSDTDRLDVLGSVLAGMSLTFGDNTQHTIYMSVDHKDTNNLTVDQVRLICELIPQEKFIVIQNRAFEFPVLYQTWGDKWKDNGWGGFIPNALDTKIGASYVDENMRKGLKERSLHHLGYQQVTYEETTSREGPVGTLTGGQVTKTWDEVLTPAVYEQVEKEFTDEETGEITTAMVDGARIEFPAITEARERRQYKMRELPATEVFDYGCDDTICTAALHTYYKFVMEIENTWNVYLEVETLPEYLTSLAYVQGIPINMAKLRELKANDAVSYDKAWVTLREFLMNHGWAGTVCPEFETSIDPSDAKMAVEILLEGEFTTRKRKLNAIAADIREQFPDSDRAEILAAIVESNNVEELNKLIKANFTGEPKINFGSPKQMQDLFYRVIGIPVRIVNKMTDNQRKNDPAMVEAFKKRRQQKDGKSVEFTTEELNALISKASTDDTAVDTALALDNLEPHVQKVLRAYKTIKEVQTRQNLFYKTYEAIPHWRDGRIHPSLNQAEAATRRYSSSGPNIQQLPSKGEGAHFRETLEPHHKDAVIVSLDWSGQELRLGAELSGDVAMTSCFVGENLRDMHSLTAVAAAVSMWGQPVTYDEFQAMRKSKEEAHAKKAKALRDGAKTVNFASQYGAMAAKIAETMMCEEETAQAFLDARAEAFPGIIAWDKRVQAEAYECGYSRTMMGARRHLREALLDDNQWERAKAERQVGNFWIQSSGSEMVKLSMARVWKSGIVTGKFDCVFYCPIHDELVLSVHRDHAVEVIQIVHACMVAPYSTMKIPLESSIAIGPNFACDYEIGTVPDLAVINEVLNKIFHKNTTKEAA